MTFKQFFQRLFPKLFKQPVSKPVEAPSIDAPVVVATSVPKPAEVAPAPVVSGPVLGPATIALTGPITGNVQPGTPITPLIDARTLYNYTTVLDKTGVLTVVPAPGATYSVPVLKGQRVIITSGDSTTVTGTLYDSAGNPLATSNSPLYFYLQAPQDDTLRLVLKTDLGAHIERQGDA